MRKIIIIFFIVLIYQIGLPAQEFECGTKFDPKDTIHLPHFGQNVILDMILEITMKEDRGSSVGSLPNNTLFNIPVKIWVFRDDNGTNAALSEANVQLLFNEVNRLYSESNTGIQFYMKCGIQYVNSSKYNTIDNDGKFEDMIASYRETYALNWYLVSESPGWAGMARFPWKSNNFSFALRCGGRYPLSAINRARASVHEIGHTLGLLHTHESARSSGTNGDASKCFQEAVSRSKTQGIGCVGTIGKKKCEINGDTLCDTDAAPNRNNSESIWVNQLCNYVNFSGHTDNWGDTWIPPTTNYMSYLSEWDCMRIFTRGQIGVMYSTILYRMTIVPLFIFHPWYNLHSITLSGSVKSGEKESYIVPLKIEAAPGNSAYIINSGGSVNLFAGESIILKPGFHASAGSTFTARVGELTSCSTILPNTIKSVDSDSDVEVISILSQEDIDKCISIITKALNREYYNYSKENFSDDNSIIDIDFDFTIYPNPNDGNFTILIEADEMQPFTIEIYDSIGFLMSKTDYCDTYIVNVNQGNLVSGVYFVKITMGNSFVTKQVVIQ